ncbi:MAG: D-alanyl-D-alanine carboxypeptidase [Candidatus Magasanikbacteria bacterium]|nr:D-alanyl-D-alanine carboxypeptidase [Candidatus Magasanikbacteria bacterium]
MPKTGWLFAFLTVIGVAGAGVLMGAEILHGAPVSAEPLASAALYGFPLTGRTVTTVDRAVLAPPQAPKPPAPPRMRDDAPVAPGITAKSALVIDAGSGTVLFAHDADTSQPLASITKLLTALTIVDQQPEWQATTTVKKTRGIEGPHFVEEGDVVTLRDLLFASLVGSSNSATMALVDAVTSSSTSFVAKMRLKVDALGLEHMRVADPAGLSPDNVATAHDAVRLLQLAFERPLLREALGTARLDIRTRGGAVRKVESTNWLLLGKITRTIEKMIGSKTGYLPEAGYNFVTAFEDAAGHQVFVVVLGAKDHYARFTEAQALATWAYGAFVWN